MVYRVSVGLEADIGQFIPPMGSAIAVSERLDHVIEHLDRSINKLPIDSVRAAAAMQLLNGDVQKFGDNVLAIGNKSSAMQLVDQRIRSTRNEIRQLIADFEKTGDADIFKRLGGKQGDLNALTDIRARLSKAIKDAATDGMSSMEKSLETSFSKGLVGAFTNPYVLGAVGVLAAAIGPLVLSAIGGAVIATGAAAVVGLGIAGAAKANPEAVGAAWHGVIERVKSEWLAGSQSFVKPTIEAIHTLGNAIGDLHIAQMLQKASTFVAPLAQGVAGFVSGIGQGLSALVDKAGPVIDMLKSALPQLGSDIGEALKLIAGGNKGAAEGLKDVLDFTGRVIIGIGGAIRLAEDFYSAIKNIGNAIRSITDINPLTKWLTDKISPRDVQAFAVSLDGAAHGLDKTKDSAQGAQENLAKLRAQLNSTAESADTLAAAMVKKIFTATMNLDQAVLSAHDSLNQLKDAFHQNGKAIDEFSVKGIANRRAVLSVVSANMELYQAQISAGMSAEDAAAAYDQNTASLERQLRKAGLTANQIQGLIGKYKNVPGKVNTIMAIQGLTEAINGLADLLRLINHIPSNKTTTITTRFVTTGSRAGQMLSGQSRLGGQGAQGAIRMADGGALVAPSNPGTFLFAEPQTGGEAFIPLRGITQSRAMGLAQVVGNNYGFDVRSRDGDQSTRTLVMPPMQRFEELFIWMWRRLNQQGAFS